ncbi:MAG TPA: glycosyltransferase, partial [Bryobacteraceae bacterium]|nr:glycosyltransferase [Bryobacteraceae bacterium]
MRRVLFTTFGSYGDLFPYLAVGAELRSRGHEVTVGTSPAFRAKVEEAGLAFHAVRPDVSLDNSELLAYIFDAKKGSERVVRLVASVVRDSYEDTLGAAQRADIIVTHPITFGAVLVARKLRMRWASSVLAPISFMSTYDPPLLPPAPWLTRSWPFGRSLLGVLFSFGQRSALPWVAPVLQLASELGLPPGGNPVFDGSHSPALVLALYSRLLGGPQPDWPQNTLQTGFAFYNESAVRPLDPELSEFFDQGAPVVFTLGSSAVSAAGDFYRDSFQAVQRLGAHALFLTGSHSQGLPAQLPEGVLVRPYAPHSLVFPRAAAIVHQGGVGTTAQALRAGRPMLIVPFAHDQFDNAERLKRLGAAEVIYRSKYSSRNCERQLGKLLSGKEYGNAALGAAATMRAETGAA